MWIPALVFTSVLIVFLMAVFFFAPRMTDDQRKILLLLYALLAGCSTVFLGGTALLDLGSESEKGVKLGFSATAGVAVFALCYLFPPYFLRAGSGGVPDPGAPRDEGPTPAEKGKRIDSEIAHRLAALPALLQDPFTFTQLHTAKAAVSGKAEPHPSKRGKLGEFVPLFGEFADRGLFELLWELHELVPASEKEPLGRALGSAKKLPAYLNYDHLIRVAPVGEEDSKWKMAPQFTEPYRELLRGFAAARWPVTLAGGDGPSRTATAPPVESEGQGGRGGSAEPEEPEDDDAAYLWKRLETLERNLKHYLDQIEHAGGKAHADISVLNSFGDTVATIKRVLDQLDKLDPQQAAKQRDRLKGFWES